MAEISGEKQLIFLTAYKEGFAELARLVKGFEGMTEESQSLYITYAEESLKEQLVLIDIKKTEVLAEVKQWLAKYNSQFKALLDTEKFITEQLEHYKLMRTVITNDETGQQTEERAAI